jgi:hypothetical protein
VNKTRRDRRTRDIISLEECRLQLVGNSDSDGSSGWLPGGRGGGIVSVSARESTEAFVFNPLATAGGAIVGFALNATNEQVVRAGKLDEIRGCSLRSVVVNDPAKCKTAKQSQREIANMKVDNDLSNNQSGLSEKAKPNSFGHVKAQSMSHAEDGAGKPRAISRVALPAGPSRLVQSVQPDHGQRAP